MIWATVAVGALFEPGPAIAPTGEWSNKVMLADLDGDGDLDIVFANGGDYASAGTPAPQRLFRNLGGSFEPWSLPGSPELSRSIQAGDLDGDGRVDLFVSAVYQRPSRLFLGSTDGFVEASERLPSSPLSIGDVALGDVDGDGDLDAVLADWGPGDPLSNGGAPARLWLNDGGTFTEAEGALPSRPIGMSWDLELVDLDGDFDLDLLISSKPDVGSALFLNRGDGTFDDASENLPAFTNNYEFAPMDVDGDGDFDLVTINDGPSLREHVLINDGNARFHNGNGTHWPPSENAGEDDNVVVFADLDDDGDPDFLIGSLSGEDRVIVNTGGQLTDGGSAFSGPFTPGTLGLALGDLDGDGRVDAVMAQGELAEIDLIYMGVDTAVDTHAPVLMRVQQIDGAVRVQVHDRMTPARPSDLKIFVRHDRGETDLQHRGGFLWGGTFPVSGYAELCARDRQANQECQLLDPTGPGPGNPDLPCGCRTPGAPLWLAPIALLIRRRNTARFGPVSKVSLKEAPWI